MKDKQFFSSPLVMVLEFLFFYVSVPFIADEYLEGWNRIIPLIIIAIIFLFFLLSDPGFDNKILYEFDKYYLRKSIPRILIISILLVWFTIWIFPYLFFQYPMENFEGYVITLFLYPIASVIPQELIYRVYFFHRYKTLIPERYLLMLSNAIIFGFTHLIYDNWVAPIATFLASWIFIFNYLKSKSLLNVSVEHYIYGFIMFTIGFGYFFQ